MRVYCGTYAKYNDGNISGHWLDLEDYTDKDAFIEACKELHNDETDPELMFQDYENIPDGYMTECSIDESLFLLSDLMENTDEIPALLHFASKYFGNGEPLENVINEFQDRFICKSSDHTDLFWQYLEIAYPGYDEDLISFLSPNKYSCIEDDCSLWTMEFENEYYLFHHG